MAVNLEVTVKATAADQAIRLETVPDLLIVDWSNLIHRTFHGLGGDPTLLARDICLIAEQSLNSIASGILYSGYKVAIVLDGGHSGRRDIYAGYKSSRSNRDDRPPALVSACEGPLRDQWQRLNVVQMYGYEADDTMAALANMHTGNSYILTNDRDLLQAVNDHVWVIVPKGQFDAPDVMGVDEVREKYGFEPSMIPHYKALQGDKSDDVPQIPGIGHGKACMLIQNFRDIDGAWLAAMHNALTPRLTATLIGYRAQIQQNLRLVTLVPVPGLEAVYTKIMEQ